MKFCLWMTALASLALGQQIPVTGVAGARVRVADLAKARETLDAWIKQHGNSGRTDEMENRQALLEYDKNAQKSLDYITRKLGLYFNQERETVDQQRQLPTALDANLISRATLTARALAIKPHSGG